LGFERLTNVPIQTKMIKDANLTKEERQWIKVRAFRYFSPFFALADPFILQDHNRRCLEKLEPYIREDKRALKWLRREAERGIGMASPGPGGVFIDWD
jgi:Xaa-Pro aminopeptidase